jgi:hypothetical protein
MKTLVRLAASLLLAAAFPSQAAFRAYVSITGTDNPSCSLGAPCRLMAAAMTAVADGGEIWLLDSGNFNLVTVDVTKSVSIDAVPGAIGSILALNGPAIRVNTPGANVVLRNLTIKQLAGNGSTHGVEVTAAASLVIDKCTIADMPQYGITVTGSTFVQVIDTAIRNPGSVAARYVDGPTATHTRLSVTRTGNFGIDASSSSSTAKTRVDIRDSSLTGGNGAAVAATASGTGITTMVVSNTQMTGNAYGPATNTGGTGTVALTVTSSVMAGNSFDGMNIFGSGTTVVMSDNTIASNGGRGVFNFSGTVLSSGTNVVRQNTGGDANGAITLIGRI